MANRHRRHSSVDTTGWLYTHRSNEPPPPPTFLGRSISTRVSNFSREFKRQSSISHFNPGEYFTGCFGPRRAVSKDSAHQILLELDSAGASGGRAEGEPAPRPRFFSTSLLSSFGSVGACSGANWNLEMRAAELNRKAAIDEGRVRQGGRWELDGDVEYLKPPAWKQLVRKLRAQAKRHVHPAPVRELWTNYDAQSYEKNFDDGGKGAYWYATFDEDDELGVRERALHTKLLTKFHSVRYDNNAQPGLLKTLSVPVPPVKSSKPRSTSLPIWQRRTARPPLKLELTRSL